MKHLPIYYLIILILIATGNVYPGTTGKIAGHISDVQVGEPLPGANIIIEGTQLGTAADPYGNYVILNIPPGIYKLKISMMGYKDYIVQNVQIMIDLTTTINGKLQPTVIEGESVIIVAERPLVQMDMTSSLTSVGSEEIELLPAQSISGLLELQAGIINYQGVHVRGGRSGEIAYWIDGVATTESFYGGEGITVENSAIEELQVISGTYNAEYGQAMSGIVNIITKEGRAEYSGQVRAYMGDYISGSDIYSVLKRLEVTETEDGSLQEYVEYENPLKKLNLSYNTELSLSGPVPFTKDKLTFFTNGRYFSDEGFYYGKYWFTPQNLPGDSSLVALNPYERLSVQGKLTWHITPNIKISYNSFWNDWNRERSYNQNVGEYRNYKYNPYGIPRQFGYSTTNILSWNQIISPTTFYEIRINRFYSERKQYVYKNPTETPHWMARVTDESGEVHVLDLDTAEGRAQLQEAQVNQLAYEYFIDPNDADGYVHQDSLITPAQYSFRRAGADLNHNFRSTNYWIGKLDLVSQVTMKHQLKFGGEIRLYQLDLDNIRLQAKTDQAGNTVEPFTPAIPASSTIYHHKYTRKPREISAYIQDKMEYSDLIVNLGFRFDYFNANSTVPADPTDPNIYDPFRPENKYRGWQDPPEGLNYAELEAYKEGFEEYTPEERRAFMHKDADAKTQISPRLGLAYPISEKGVIHFSYGHFFQIPEFQYLYDIPDFKLASGNNNVLGNANLNPQKTVQYEVGLSQQLTNDMGLDVTVFYRDIRDWVGTSPVQKTARPSVSYVTYVNWDYSNVRGFNVRVDKRIMNHWGARIDYSYQAAEGTYSNPRDAFNAYLANKEPRNYLIPLNWDQRHTLSGQIILMAYNWTATLLAKYNTGTPYTPTFAVAEVVGATSYTGLTDNSARKPQICSFDLYLTKAFKLKIIDLTFFMYVYNLFNQRGETGVYSDTGEASYTTNPREELYTPVIDRIGTYMDYFTRSDYYISPRQVQVGFSLGF
jgi:outer membrane receptor protein involved in Fe transport